MKFNFKPIPPVKIEVDEEEAREIVRETFADEFGKGFVKDMYIGKYPSNYGLVVYLENEDDMDRIFTL